MLSNFKNESLLGIEMNKAMLPHYVQIFYDVNVGSIGCFGIIFVSSCQSHYSFHS